jgi:hypothetical protein
VDCFDEIPHPALLDRVRKRVGDKRVLALVKAFLKAGILLEDAPWKELRRRYGIWPADGDVVLFDPARVRTTRYYYRGTRIPTPWPSTA